MRANGQAIHLHAAARPRRPHRPVRGRHARDPRLQGRQGGGEGAHAGDGRARLDLQERLYADGRTGGDRSVLLVLQGMDTSGKGGDDPPRRRAGRPGRRPHRRVQATDARGARARLPVAHPPPAARAGQARRLRPLALRGRADRRGSTSSSTGATWRGATRSINRFEEQLVADRHDASSSASCTSPPRSRSARLLARLDDPTKHWKYNPGDLDDRALWDDYMTAYGDAIERCNTDAAPWHVVPADRKWYRNWAISDAADRALEEMALAVADGGLRRRARTPPPAGDSVESSAVDLDAVEVRVLGCLIEKQRTTPGRLSAQPQLAARGLQPVHEPRSRGRLRRGGDPRRAAPPRPPPLDALRERRARRQVPPPARRDARPHGRRAGAARDPDAARTADPGRAAPARRPALRVPRPGRVPGDARPADRARLHRAPRPPPGPEGGALRAPAERGPRGRRPAATPAPAPFEPAARAAPAPRSDVARIDELERQVAALTAQVAELRAAAGLAD